MTRSQSTDNYVILPDNLAALIDADASAPLGFVFSSMEAPEATLPTEADLAAIQTTSLSTNEVKNFRNSGAFGRTVYPLVEYFPQLMTLNWEVAVATATLGATSSAGSTGGSPWSVQVVDSASGTPVVGATVTAFLGTTFTGGIQAVTDGSGQAQLPVPAGTVRHLFVHPAHTHWSRHEQKIAAGAAAHVVKLDSFAATKGSALSIVQGPAVQGARGKGVRVGIIDTGVGPHPDLVLAGGSAPLSEPGGTFDDNDLHGTHVAGLIAGKGTNFPGLAPDAEVFSYRVFKSGAKSAGNSDIVAALFQAMQDGCHIVNMSLGSAKGDALIEKTVRLAISRGVLVIAASGNDSSNPKRAPIRSPAKTSGVVSVSAMGCQNSYPRDSAHVIWECSPAGTVNSHFVASFSNTGKSLVCTAPGVGLVSTIPGGYKALDGTSMAAPVVTGIAACLLSAHPHALGLPADEKRTAAFKSLLYTACKSLGFDPQLEGKKGLPR